MKKSIETRKLGLFSNRSNEWNNKKPGDKEEARGGTENGVAEEERALLGFRNLNPLAFGFFLECGG